MPVPSDKIGKTYAPVIYAVGREKIREYAQAVGETNPLYLDLEAARAAGYADLLAPPMFVVVYARPAFMARAVRPGARDRLRASRAWHSGVPLGAAGGGRRRDHDDADRRPTSASAPGLRFYTFESVSVNQRGETTCIGTWSTIIRGEE